MIIICNLVFQNSLQNPTTTDGQAQKEETQTINLILGGVYTNVVNLVSFLILVLLGTRL